MIVCEGAFFCVSVSVSVSQNEMLTSNGNLL